MVKEAEKGKTSIEVMKYIFFIEGGSIRLIFNSDGIYWWELRLKFLKYMKGRGVKMKGYNIVRLKILVNGKILVDKVVRWIQDKHGLYKYF